MKSSRHSSFTALSRGTDGTFTDNRGFGGGAFTIKVTGVNGRSTEHEFPSFLRRGAAHRRLQPPPSDRQPRMALRRARLAAGHSFSRS